MTTRPGPRRRFARPARIAILPVIALLGMTDAAHASITAGLVGTELRITGDSADDSINLRLSADGLRVEVRNAGILVNSFLRTAFSTIAIDAGRGDDTVLIDEVNGAFTNAHPTRIAGGDGEDTLQGGAGAEEIDGGPGDDQIEGGRGIDTIHGGAGDDRILWNANAPLLSSTDGADIVDGDAGDDWFEIQGNDAAETYVLGPSGSRAVVTRGGVQLNLGTVERLVVALYGGDDHFSVDPALTAPMVVSVSGMDGIDDLTGGPGNDQLSGGAGNDTIHGGGGDDVINGLEGDDVLHGDAGNDTIYGRDGNDTVFGGPGDDRFIWLYFENADVIDGGPGVDTIEATGNFPSETYTLQANGPLIQLGISPGTASISFTATERLELFMQGGDDILVVPPGLPAVNLTVDGSIGDDIIVGGAGDDTLQGGPGNDTVSGGAGNDTISGGNGDDNLFGDAGDDVLSGDAGNDLLNGGAGNDTLVGGEGVDTLRGGAGDDILRWSVLDADEVLDGDTGIDTLDFDGDALAVDRITLTPNGSRVSLSWSNMSVLTAHLDLGSIERLDVSTGGNDDGLAVMPGLIGLIEQITVDFGDIGDYLDMVASSPPVVADGGPGAPDRLRFDAQGQSVHLTATTISTQGVLRVTHTNFEEVTILNPAGTLPVVTITSPTASPAMSATSSFVTLAGTVVDDGPIVSVTWANDRGGTGVATGTTAWTIPDVALQPGLNRITVSALDSTGNMTFDTIEVTVSAFTYSLAEGATGSFFDLDVTIANPSATPAPVTVAFLRQAGAPVAMSLTLAATSRTTIHVDDVPGLENEGGISTVVTSTAAVPLVVERTMFWDASYYGSHGGTAVDGPGTRWLFAEGSEGFFNTFLLLANAGASASDVTLTFLREGSTPFVKTVTVPAASRVTVAANGIPELVGRSFSIVVDASQPIIAERAMYFGTARLFDGGHESTGVKAGATSWFLAEGATGSFFTTFVLVGNPNPAAANVTLTFLTATGQSVIRNKIVPANGRLTVNVATEDPILASAAVSTTVTADQPVIAERAMYWPGPPSTWAEAHNSFGATTLGTRWGLSEGRVGMDHAFQTYILLANPSTTAANVQITFLRASGAPVVKTVTVAPTSRFNVAVSTAAPELQDETFGALIEVTNGVGISVERAMYSDALGQVWAAGTNALGTRLP